jgi:hypothetical protein
MRTQKFESKEKQTMTLSILTNRKPVSLVFSTVLLAVLLAVAGSPFALGQSSSAHRPPAGLTGPPIAFASVASVGTKQSGTSNIRADYNSTTGLYELKITGVCFLRTSYTTVATVSGYNGFPDGALFVNTDDDGDFCHATGKLIVGLRDVNGNLEKADFQVVVFKAQ